ncbi:MAG: hypothetical protein ABI347_01230 [Nitrososphaera sp.]
MQYFTKDRYMAEYIPAIIFVTALLFITPMIALASSTTVGYPYMAEEWAG